MAVVFRAQADDDAFGDPNIGERLFLETRFAEFFFTNSGGNANFTLTNGTLTLSNGGVAGQTFVNVKVSGNKLLSSNSVVLGAISPGTGALTLTLKATATTPKITATGVILQDVSGTNAAGWFPGTDESGYFLLQP